MPQLVITAVGPDRPGLVGDFTRHVLEAGANLADSRMVNLRGQFAMLVLLDGSPAVLAAVESRLAHHAGELGLALAFAHESGAWTPSPGVPWKLTTYAMDQPGIVHRVTALLRDHRVNIEALETQLESAPFAGSPVFTMRMSVTVPPSVAVRALRRELETLCDELNCDVDLEPA